MFVATTAITLLLALLLAYTAARKLSRRPDVIAQYARVGVPEERLGLLAAILGAGAAGIVAGLFWPPIGIAATIGLTAYFLLAIGAHLRAGETHDLAPPLAMLAFAAAALALRVLTA